MPTGRYTRAKGDYGRANEELLLPFLELLHEDQHFRHTEDSKDTMDFCSEDIYIEVKTRKTYSWSDSQIQREGFLLPFCKIERALKESKKVFFYYYWKTDKSLWSWEFKKEQASLLKPFVPRWHYEKQRHVAVPVSWWRLEGIIDEEEMTLTTP